MAVDREFRPATAPVEAGAASAPLPRLVLGLALTAGLGVLLLGLWVGDAVSATSIPGLPAAGAGTAWALPIAKLVFDLSAVGTVGALLVGVALVPSAGNELTATGLRCLRAAAVWAAVWAGSALVTFVLSLSDILGLPVSEVLSANTLSSFAGSVSQGRALLFVFGLAVIIAAAAPFVLSLDTGAVLLVVSAVALLPVPLTGHAAGAADHDVATSSLVAHVIAASLWVGGLLALVLYVRRSRAALAVAVPRFSVLALWCYVAIGFSGLVNAWVRLGGAEELWTSRYGVLVAGKTAAFVALGFFGWWQRRAASSFLRLAAGEVVVMAAAIGLAVALSRTPAPVPDVPVEEASAAESLLGFDLPPYSLIEVLTSWRPDTIVLIVVGTALALYLAGVRTLSRREQRWPIARTLSWLAGLAIATFVLNSGLAAYGRALFSAHMLQHMTLTMIVPILLGMGAPITLALRALPAHPATGPRGAREWLLVMLHSRVARILTHPLVTLTLYVVTLYGFYFTPLFDLSHRSHLAHALMHVHFIAIGCLYFWPILGIDPMPRRLPPVGRMLLLFASVPFHAFFGVALMSSSTVLSEDWYASLGLPWVDSLLADQYVGAGIAWSFGEIPTLLVLAAIFVQWYRADDREAKRADRRADRDGDAELTAYNAYLARLDSRSPESRS
jgi:cytochrome c oxidase assembly factor CtaG/putative copper export protein